jgi:CubicO group peptidase (beta-lactamase class C family)
VDPETAFEAASISKPITAYVAMKLVEKRRLSLDRPLAKYLKTSYLYDRNAAAKITMRMVLNHTSGLPNDALGNDRRVYFTPGDHFSYSGGGFRYLQTVLEAVSKVPFGEYMDRELLKPLGMSRSSFVYRKDLAPNMAYGHQNQEVLPLRRTPAPPQAACYPPLAIWPGLGWNSATLLCLKQKRSPGC